MIGFKFEKQNDCYLIHQEKYIKNLLKKFKIDKYTPCSNMCLYKQRIEKKEI